MTSTCATIEGRSALLLGKAKDNNASCAIGPFIRMFDDNFTLDDVRQAVVELEIVGDDDLPAGRPQLHGRDQPRSAGAGRPDHRRAPHYPDGFVLFLGTMFAPTQDRDVAGLGFTHKGDVVRVSTPKLGVLENR